MTKQKEMDAARPQQVRWGPVDQRAPGIVVDDGMTQDYIPWEALQMEVEAKLLPQVRVVPRDAVVVLSDLGDRKNWIVQILDASKTELGHVWFGPDPDSSWAWDGLVRLGNVNREEGKSPVWQIFQRYSDGSYRRTEARAITREDL